MHTKNAERRGRAAKSWLAAGLLVALTGCAGSPVASGLEEVEANRVVLALDRAKVAGEKEADPTVEGKFRVLVGRDDATRALAALRDEDLPQTRPAGLLEAASASGSLVPSAAAEHAALVAGIQGELARTLESVQGVLRARVHVNLPQADALSPYNERPKASASVLLEHGGSTAPISSEAVEQLVSHAVGDLDARDVAVVMTGRATSSAAPAGAQLAHVFSIAVAPGSVRILHVVFSLGGVVVLGLLVLVGLLFRRVHRLEGVSAGEEARDG